MLKQATGTMILLVYVGSMWWSNRLHSTVCRFLPSYSLVLGPSRSPPCLERDLFTWLSWQFLIGWGTCEPWQIVLVHRTVADKARQDVLRYILSNVARQAPILSPTCLNSPHTSRQVKISFVKQTWLMSGIHVFSLKYYFWQHVLLYMPCHLRYKYASHNK